MELIGPYLEAAAFIIELIAVALLIVGAIRFLWAVAKGAVQKHHLSAAIPKARLNLGPYILGALEFLIVADIIQTIVHRTLEDVVILAVVVAVRTAISIFLTKEIEELRKETGMTAPADDNAHDERS